VFALRKKGAHRCCFQTVAKTRGIGRRFGNAEEIIRVLFHHGFFLRIVRDNLVGTGSGTLRRQVGGAPVLHLAFAVTQVRNHRLLVDYRQAHERSDERRIGLGQCKFDRGVVDGFRLFDICKQIRQPLAHRLHAIEREHHVFSGHLVAGDEFHIVTQLEGEACAVAFPAFGQVRHMAGPTLCR